MKLALLNDFIIICRVSFFLFRNHRTLNHLYVLTFCGLQAVFNGDNNHDSFFLLLADFFFLFEDAGVTINSAP